MVTSICIAKTVYGGDGIGRLGDGRVVFVPGAFAGELVKAEVTGEKKRFARARLVSVEESSPDRTGEGEPPVPGMVYANLSRRAEIAAKDDQLRNFFERARIDVEGPFEGPSGEPAPVPPGYRNKVVYHFAKEGGEWKIGYRREPGHDIVDVTSTRSRAPRSTRNCRRSGGASSRCSRRARRPCAGRSSARRT